MPTSPLGGQAPKPVDLEPSQTPAPRRFPVRCSNTPASDRVRSSLWPQAGVPPAISRSVPLPGTPTPLATPFGRAHTAPIGSPLVHEVAAPDVPHVLPEIALDTLACFMRAGVPRRAAAIVVPGPTRDTVVASSLMPAFRAVSPADALMRDDLQRGEDALRNGELRAAAESFGRVLTLAPKQADALAGLGAVHWESGAHTAAIDCYTRAIEHAPEHAPARLRRAMAATRLALLGQTCAGYDAGEMAFKDFSVAYQLMAKAGKLDAGAMAHYAYLCVALGRIGDAQKALTDVAQSGTATNADQVLLAQVLRQGGQLARSRAVLDHVLEHTPGFAPAWLALGDLFLAHREAAYALQSYESAANIVGKTSAVLVRLAKAHGANGTAAAQLSALNTALAQNPQDTEALQARAAYHIARLDGAAALADLEKVLQVIPDCPYATLLKGQAQQVCGRSTSAQQTFTRVLYMAEDALATAIPYPELVNELHTLQRDALAGRALAEATSRSDAKAEKDMSDAQQVFNDPPWPPAPLGPQENLEEVRPELEVLYLAQGHLQLSRGDAGKALTAFDLALRHSQGGLRSVLGHAMALKAMHQFNGALRALANIQDVPGIVLERGYLHLKLHAWEPAERCFNTVLATRSENAEALAGRGEAKRMLGDREGAKADFEMARQLDGFNQYATEGLRLMGGTMARFHKPKPRD